MTPFTNNWNKLSLRRSLAQRPLTSLALPSRSCWQPWWPCQAGSWRSSSGRDRPTSSAPGCRSACSSPRLGTESWEEPGVRRFRGQASQLLQDTCNRRVFSNDSNQMWFTTPRQMAPGAGGVTCVKVHPVSRAFQLRVKIPTAPTWRLSPQSWQLWLFSPPLSSSPSSHCSALPSAQRSPLKRTIGVRSNFKSNVWGLAALKLRPYLPFLFVVKYLESVMVAQVP